MEYEVFLSFRGPDVRTTFADHLYQFLDNYGIRTFLDNEELRKGEKCAPEIIKAIEESRVYIPIFSPGYATSKWCLREVAHMLKCSKKDRGHIILPIFYLMEPKDVRHQKRSYEEAFQRHKEVYGEATVMEWKGALKEVGDIQGWEVNQSERQGAIVREVFSRVRSHLMGSYLLVTEELVNIGPHIEQVTNQLKQGVKVVGIVGMGGLGKTTIAMAVRDKVYTEFEYCCFLRDVRETLSEKGGIETLQKQILSAIPGHDGIIQDASQGIRMIKDRVCKHNALIIIDDIDERFEFGQILGKLEDFSSETRFIITTRNKRVMDFFQHESYEPEDLNHDYSLQLFSRHAFGSDYPPNDRVALSCEFLKVTTGLPLAIKVIGSTLMRKNERFWEEKLKQLRKIPPAEVQERLMISFLDLTLEEQEIFLDIASVFIGEEIENPFYMWSACEFYPEIGVDILILKSLMKVNLGNTLWMHDSIRDLGRAIICKKDSWRNSRMWCNQDALDMLTNDKGSDRVEVLRVDMCNETFNLTNKQFAKLSRLRYLEVSNGNFEGNFENLLPDLRWLQLVCCGSLPVDLNMEKLVVLSVNDCSVRDDWSGWVKIKGARNLKSITVDHGAQLLRPPDLSQCGNLESVNLDYCSDMSGELHIGNLLNLKLLNFKHTRITKLNGDIAMLQNLKEVHTSFLEELPDGMDRLTKLENLTINYSMFNGVLALPTSLKVLKVCFIQISNILDLEHLWVLELASYKHQLPGDIWKLSRLMTLELSSFRCESVLAVGNGMDAPCCLPSSLEVLQIKYSEGLKTLPNLANFSNLTRLHLRCVGVREILGLSGLRMLDTFIVSDVPKLINLDGLEHLKLLKEITVENCPALERLPNLWNITKLKTLEIGSCQFLSRFCISFEVAERSSNFRFTNRLDLNLEPQEYAGPSEFLSNLSHPRELELKGIGGNSLLSREPFLHLSGLHCLDTLSICNCERLVEVIVLDTLESLRCLSIEDCTSLTKLSNPSGLKNLKRLEIHGCKQLTDVMWLEKLESLQYLKVTDRTSIKKLSLSCLKHLQELEISGCTQLTVIPGLEGLESLRELLIRDCKSIERLPCLSRLKLINRLDTSGCTQLAAVVGLEKLKSLKSLKMTNCVSIEKLPDLSCLKELWDLDLSGCTQLTEVSGIANLKELTCVTIDERLKTTGMECKRLY